MSLVAKPFARKNLNAFNFIAISFVKDGKIPPRAMLRVTDLIFPFHFPVS